jgi:hypothetical protein
VGEEKKELSEIFENGLVYIPRRRIMVPFQIHKFGEERSQLYGEYNLFLVSLWENVMNMDLALPKMC